MDAYDHTHEAEKRRVDSLIHDARQGGMDDAQIVTLLAKLLAETSADAILARSVADRHENEIKRSQEELRKDYTTLAEERRQVVAILTKAGCYYPESKEDEALPFWISGLVLDKEKTADTGESK